MTFSTIKYNMLYQLCLSILLLVTGHLGRYTSWDIPRLCGMLLVLWTFFRENFCAEESTKHLQRPALVSHSNVLWFLVCWDPDLGCRGVWQIPMLSCPPDSSCLENFVCLFCVCTWLCVFWCVHTFCCKPESWDRNRLGSVENTNDSGYQMFCFRLVFFEGVSCHCSVLNDFVSVISATASYFCQPWRLTMVAHHGGFDSQGLKFLSRLSSHWTQLSRDLNVFFGMDNTKVALCWFTLLKSWIWSWVAALLPLAQPCLLKSLLSVLCEVSHLTLWQGKEDETKQLRKYSICFV